MSLETALLLDALVVTGCAVMLRMHYQSRLAHPATIYVVFHVAVLSARGWAVLAGAPSYMGVDPNEFASFIWRADLFLLCATIGWTSLGRAERSGYGEPETEPNRPRQDPSRLERATALVAVVAVPLGLWSLVRGAYVPGIERAATAEIITSYQTVAILWPALILIAFVYTRGFRVYLMAPLMIYIIIMGIQGANRYRFVLPLLMLLVIYLDQRARRWPPVWMLPVAAAVLAIFIPLKQIGMEIRSGEASLNELSSAIVESTSEASRGTSPEQALLDQATISMVLARDQGYVGVGRSYAALVTLPVPRPWWPDKPTLAGDLTAISTARYPLSEVGAVTTLPGEMYINFRTVGLVVGGLLFGRISGVLHRFAYSRPRLSATRFLYLLILVSLVQVSRDGLSSLVLFTIVNAGPWVAIAGLATRIARKARLS